MSHSKVIMTHINFEFAIGNSRSESMGKAVPTVPQRSTLIGKTYPQIVGLFHFLLIGLCN